MSANIQMVIVSLLNVSNPESLNTDSGYITQRLIGTELAARGHKFILLAPVHAREPFECHYTSMGHTKYEVRFGVNYRDLYCKLRRVLKKYGAIDWVWVNQPETIAAIRAILSELGSDDTRIFTYVHYLPVLRYQEGELVWDPSLNDGNLAPVIMNRIAEGCNLADAVGIHTEFGKKLLLSAAAEARATVDGAKISVMPIAADPMLIRNKPPVMENIQDTLFGYPNRLYAHYGTGEMFKYFEMMRQDLPLKVWISDQINSRSRLRQRLDPSTAAVAQKIRSCRFVVRFHDQKDRQLYRDIISRSSVIFGPNRTAALWSLSIIDAMGMGIPVMAPDAGGYREMLPQSCLWSDYEDLSNKVYNIIKNERTWLDIARKNYDRSLQYRPAVVVNNIESALGV